MLVLSRKAGEVIWIGDKISVRVMEVLYNGRVRLGIEAPPEVTILREELKRPQLTPIPQPLSPPRKETTNDGVSEGMG